MTVLSYGLSRPYGLSRQHQTASLGVRDFDPTCTLGVSHPVQNLTSCTMHEDKQLKVQLAGALCAIMEGWTQELAGGLLRQHQSELSRLRNNELERFSVARLVRLITSRGYNVEVHLEPIPRRYANPGVRPSVAVVRYDIYGRVVE